MATKKRRTAGRAVYRAKKREAEPAGSAPSFKPSGLVMSPGVADQWARVTETLVLQGIDPTQAKIRAHQQLVDQQVGRVAVEPARPTDVLVSFVCSATRVSNKELRVRVGETVRELTAAEARLPVAALSRRFGTKLFLLLEVPTDAVWRPPTPSPKAWDSNSGRERYGQKARSTLRKFLNRVLATLKGARRGQWRLLSAEVGELAIADDVKSRWEDPR